MIKCQDSPVEHRMSRRKDVVKSLKLACSFSSALGLPILARPKKERPMMANMKKRIIKRRPSEPRDYEESTRVWKMICSF